MGGELGNETYIDPLLVSSALSQPHLILIENDYIHTNLVSKSWCLGVFEDISAISSPKKKLPGTIFHIRFFSHNQWCVRVSASNVCSPICSGSRGTTLGSFLRFTAGPARICALLFSPSYIVVTHNSEYNLYSLWGYIVIRT